MNSLFDNLQKALTNQAMEQITKQVDLPTQQGGDIANGVLGLIFDKLGKNAQDPQQAEAIVKAADQHDAGILDDVLGAIQGGQISEQDGSNILDHIFGSQQKEQAATAIAKESGIDTSKVLNMMKYLAPLALAALNKQKKESSDSFGIDDMVSMLGQSGSQANNNSSLSSTLITSLLDQDGDGSLGISDIISVATSQKKKKSGGLLGGLLNGLLGGKSA